MADSASARRGILVAASVAAVVSAALVPPSSHSGTAEVPRPPTTRVRTPGFVGPKGRIVSKPVTVGYYVSAWRARKRSSMRVL